MSHGNVTDVLDPVTLQSMEGQRALRSDQKHHHLCSEDEQRFGAT